MQKHVLSTDYVFGRHTFDSDLHVTIVRHDLTRHLGRLLPDLTEEIRKAIDEVLCSPRKDGDKGSSNKKREEEEPGGWRKKNTWKSMHDITLRVACRTIFGRELLHKDDGKFLKILDAHSSTWALTTTAIRVLIPEVLKPILSPLFALVPKWVQWRAKRYIVPVVKKRLEALKSAESEKHQHEEDVLQYLMEASMKENGDKLDIDGIISILLMLNFAAIHTTTLMLTFTLYDILSYRDPTKKVLDGSEESPSVSTQEDLHPWEVIRLEALAALAQRPPSPTTSLPNATTPQPWTRISLSPQSLPTITSAIRESMRLNASGRAMMHQVVSPSGLTLTIPPPSTSDTCDPGKQLEQEPKTYHFPPGSRIGLPISRIHHDADFYADPDTYDPYRFVPSPPRCQGSEHKQQQEERSQPQLSQKQPDIATTSPTFLAFTHGRHACPGRFFASAVLKMIVAEVAMRCEVRYLESRPENWNFSDAVVPGMKGCLWVRARERE